MEAVVEASQSKLVPSVKTARPAPMMPLAAPVAESVTWVLAGAETSNVPELEAEPKASVPRASRVSVVPPASTEIVPPD